MTQLESCIYCNHKWKWGEHKIHHLLNNHWDKIPIKKIQAIIVWYYNQEQKTITQEGQL